MITFKEGQDKIYIGKNKLTKNVDFLNHLDYHIVMPPHEESGYQHSTFHKENGKLKEKITLVKFVVVITFKNIYSFEDIKAIEVNDFPSPEFWPTRETPNIMCWGSGGYEYDKSKF